MANAACDIKAGQIVWFDGEKVRLHDAKSKIMQPIGIATRDLKEGDVIVLSRRADSVNILELPRGDETPNVVVRGYLAKQAASRL